MLARSEGFGQLSQGEGNLAVFGVKFRTNPRLLLGRWRWSLHYLLRSKLSITITFNSKNYPFFKIEFEGASKYNRSHIFHSWVTAVENCFEDNSIVQPNSILGPFS